MTATTSKAPNYTAEQVAQMQSEYTASPTAETVAALAESFGKSVAAVRMKLVSMGIYQKKEYIRKDGAKVEKKDQTATAIGNILGLSEADTDSLAKANRKALQAIFDALANSKPIN